MASAVRLWRLLQISVASLLIVAVFPHRGGAQSTGASTHLDGIWHGTSICTAAGRPACHDETVVYRIRSVVAQPQRDSVEWVMNKIVGGAEEWMATLPCTVNTSRAAAQCPMRGWMWSFRLTGDTLRGTLDNPAGVTWRNIVVARQNTSARAQ
jgi:hypothetical protein